MSKEIVHGKSKPSWIKRVCMYFSRRFDQSFFGYEALISGEGDKDVPYKLARFIRCAKKNLFVFSDFLNPDIFLHRSVLDAFGDANMRKVDIRVVVGYDYDKASVGIIDGSLGGILINVLEGETRITHPFITADGKHVWLENAKDSLIICRMDVGRFARELEAKFLKIYYGAQPLLLEPTKIPI